MKSTRALAQLIKAHPTSDGDGVKIQRVAGFDNQQFSPFLMLDELKSDERADYVGGFPPHPHRGIETLTYMLDGHFQHKDHMGHVGELRTGGAQWMAAGRGIIHSEMPIMEDGALHGFQLWINQPASQKMSPAQYQDFQPETITEYREQGIGLVRVIAGEFTLNDHTLNGPVTCNGAEATVADWHAANGEKLSVSTPFSHNVLIYVYKGQLQLGDQALIRGTMALLTAGDTFQLDSTETSGALILIGEPINEPVVHYGPFVMNTVAEIEQAIQDYNAGKFANY
ncbi:pirin family protein [Vibrio sp.]|uniref:pirin family protein n=1 Tax=Vibrio sp. TaxID=678 RepID=UPI003D12D4F0